MISHNVPVFTTRRMSGVRRMPNPEPYGSPREYFVIGREIDGLLCFLPQTYIQSASVWKRTFPLSQSACPLDGSVSVWKRTFFGASKLPIQDSRESTSRSLRSYLSSFFRRISCSYNVPVFTTRRLSGVRQMPDQGRMSAA